MLLRRMMLALAATAGLWAGHAGANSIAINFSGGSGDDGGGPHVLGPAEVAGVVAQPFWNDGPLASGSSGPLVDNTGAATTATASWTSNNTWGTTPPGGNPGSNSNDRMLANYLDAGTGGPATVTVSNIPYSTYDVIVYTRRNETATGGPGNDVGPHSPGTFSDYTVNGTTLTGQTGNVFYSTNGWVQATPTQIGNYVEFTGVTGSTMTLQANLNGNNFRSPVDGLQIVNTSSAVPEPASMSLLAAGLLGAGGMSLLRRRGLHSSRGA